MQAFNAKVYIKIGSYLGVPLEAELCSELLFPKTLFLDTYQQIDWWS